jgi:hypothetical protein
MTESSTVYMQRSQSLHLTWLPTMVFKPRLVFNRLTQQTNSWFTPMLALTLAILLNVLANGWLNHQAALSGNIPTPPDFQYWSPEMQAQYFQSQQVRQGPVFLYVIPALGNVATTWIGWMLVSGILHLMLTLLGGRGETNVSVTIVAWASLPFVVRALVRAIYLVSTRQFISAPGLSGFAEVSSSTGVVLIAKFLSLVDIYLVWHILLLILGVRICTGLSTAKSTVGVLTVIGIVLLLQTLLGYLTYQFSTLTVIRPFFF